MLTTRSRIKIAAALSMMVRAARTAVGSTNDQVLLKRDGIAWCLDLKEGIDFGLFLGLYERSTTMAIRRLVRSGDIVLDVGANIGTHTLELARQVGSAGEVFAFEPTLFAHAKLLQNIALNPSLAGIVQVEQLMLAASDHSTSEPLIYSSWPLVRQDSLHPKHLGSQKTTAGARTMSLDTYLQQAEVPRVDFIKLDVDGRECEVLEGAQKCLEKFRPIILMELAPYCLRDRGGSVQRLVDSLCCWDYQFARLNREELPIDTKKLDRAITEGAGINVIARPHRSRQGEAPPEPGHPA
jgi:FkbM family methyltransferase